MGEKLERLSNIPADEVDETIEDFKADPNYVSHEKTDNSDGTFTLEVTLKVPGNGG